ncbi:MAG: antirestriction protein ArdA [Cyanobacteria bacterium]|nr:antirestriction protein ArdA [Cyanobacteriota bacterium]
MTTTQISAHEWLEISENYYDQILGAVPPLNMESNKFICSEKYSDDDDGNDLYFVGCINKTGHFGRYMTIADYKEVFPYMITSDLRHESVLLIDDDQVEAYKAFIENEQRSNSEESRTEFVERYRGTYDSTEDYTEQNYQNYYGSAEELPDWVLLHIDFENLALTLFCNHNIYYLNSDDRKIFVFDNP